MCGIAGLISRDRPSLAVVHRMIRQIIHRGPDDEGVWIDESAGVALGHRRLAIVDLSPAGHQPMLSADGRFVFSFNGEIYNHAELRKILEDQGRVPNGGWRGHSDTEVFLQAIAVWGLEQALTRSVGMFAFALWDSKDRTLKLVRDRFGEKPLYYGWAGSDFLFGSELKAITAHPQFHNAIDRRALQLFAARTYIPAPFSIYERVFKLPPGCILSVTTEAAARPVSAPPAEGSSQGGLSISCYWSYRDVVRRGLDQPINDERDAVDELESSLARAISDQSMADVPVGAFLSGGIDSSTVCAIYQKHSSIPVHTFSIGFETLGFNEAEYAKAVARHLGTVHNERYVTVKETQDVIPLLPTMFDEPFADSSQIPTYLVSAFAREQVTVALTGDGGDELFGGYRRHSMSRQIWQAVSKVPLPVRAAAGSLLSSIPSAFWTRLAHMGGKQGSHWGGVIQETFRAAGSSPSFDALYCSYLDEWAFQASPVTAISGADPGFSLEVPGDAPDEVRAMYCDAVSYLPDDILCKVDRAAMAVSLETRVPFLDHRVAELAARIPLKMKIRGRNGKLILRQLLGRELPQHLFERPKAGFSIPIGDWLKGPLRPWAEELLDPTRMALDGWFDPRIVRRRWDDHLAGRRDGAPAIWAVLMFQGWLRKQ